MKVKLIKLEKHLWTKDKWIEDKNYIEIDDNYIPSKDDFFILKNSDIIYKCHGKVIYETVGVKLYVEALKKIG